MYFITNLFSFFLYFFLVCFVSFLLLYMFCVLLKYSSTSSGRPEVTDPMAEVDRTKFKE